MKKNIIIFCLIFVVFIFIVYLLYVFNYIPHKKYSNDYFNIEVYKSSIDKDNDGINDQKDILDNAKKYVSTKPKYKSKYYNSGYPDDNYGVCSDVIAYALLGAGYDLRTLVDNDIMMHNDLYNIDKRDDNIDFRRVKNLNIYFKNNSISLTTDVYDISSWQGGDIVVFKNHIGIISDNRNKRGVAFVIHHYSPYQKYYEEDILEVRHDIVGHYRVS